MQLKESSQGTTIFFILFLVLGGVEGFLCMLFLNGDFGSLIGILIISVFNLFFAGAILYNFAQTWKVAKPAIVLTATQVRVGETVGLTYTQKIKRAADTEHVTFKLILRESATYRRGTDTVTVTHDYPIDEFGYPAEHYPGGHVLEGNWQIQIPPDSMHTFKGSRNKLQWFLQIHVGIKGWADYKRDFEIHVTP